MLDEETYYKEKKEKKIWLILFPVIVLPGVISAAFFIYSLLWPENFTSVTGSDIFKLTMTGFIPLIMLALAGFGLFMIGYRKKLFFMKIGIAIIFIAASGFIPFSIQYYIDEYMNQPVNYSELTNIELQELADEDGDKYAAYVLKKRIEEKEKTAYLKLNNEQLYTLWKANGDLIAYEEIRKRYMRYKVERIKYSRLPYNELKVMYEEKKDMLAWFEIESRKRVFSTGEGIF